MDYLDYLPHYSYDELPTEVRAAIDRASYEERRRLAMSLPQMKVGGALPPVLQSAFQSRFEEGEERLSHTTKQKLPLRRPVFWLTAAGWLLFLLAGNLLFLRPATEKTIYRLVSAEVPEPEIVYLRDTVIKTVHRTRVRAQIDTLYLPSPPPEERLVYVQDTIFVPMPLGNPSLEALNESRSLEGRESVLELLFATE
ncbi:MAG: hypothetical protein AAGA62_02540 [Bacteroidota bacterium]